MDGEAHPSLHVAAPKSIDNRIIAAKKAAIPTIHFRSLEYNADTSMLAYLMWRVDTTYTVDGHQP